jgi:hypothetical protein
MSATALFWGCSMWNYLLHSLSTIVSSAISLSRTESVSITIPSRVGGDSSFVSTSKIDHSTCHVISLSTNQVPLFGDYTREKINGTDLLFSFIACTLEILMTCITILSTHTRESGSNIIRQLLISRSRESGPSKN